MKINLNKKLKFNNIIGVIMFILVFMIVSALIRTGMRSKINTSINNSSDKSLEELKSEVYDYVIDEEWKDFHSTIGQFKVRFPVFPTQETQNLPIPNTDLTYKEVIYTAEQKNGTIYFIFAITYPPELDVYSNPEFILEGSLSGVLAVMPNTELLSSQMTTFNEYPALDFLIQNEILDLYVKGRLILVGQNLYELLLQSERQNYKESDYIQFINSFELVK